MDKAVVPGVIAQIQYGAHATFLKSFCSIWLLKGRKGVVNIGKCAVVTSFGYGINGVVISVQKLSGIVFDMSRIFTGAALKNRDVVCECQNNTN